MKLGLVITNVVILKTQKWRPQNFPASSCPAKYYTMLKGAWHTVITDKCYLFMHSKLSLLPDTLQTFYVCCHLVNTLKVLCLQRLQWNMRHLQYKWLQMKWRLRLGRLGDETAQISAMSDLTLASSVELTPSVYYQSSPCHTSIPSSGDTYWAAAGCIDWCGSRNSSTVGLCSLA